MMIVWQLNRYKFIMMIVWQLTWYKVIMIDDCLTGSHVQSDYEGMVIWQLTRYKVIIMIVWQLTRYKVIQQSCPQRHIHPRDIHIGHVTLVIYVNDVK